MKKRTSKGLTNDPRQYEVAVLAVFQLGGATQSIDTEDAAVQCHQIAPHLFSWQKHKEQINLELVRVSLSDAKKAKNGGLLTGSGREGWRLSNKGLDWIRSQEAAETWRAQPENHRRPSKAGSIDSVRRERERARITSTSIWEDWKQTGAIEPRGARQIFRIDDYTTEKMARIKISRLRSMFDSEDDLTPFLDLASSSLIQEQEK